MQGISPDAKFKRQVVNIMHVNLIHHNKYIQNMPMVPTNLYMTCIQVVQFTSSSWFWHGRGNGAMCIRPKSKRRCQERRAELHQEKGGLILRSWKWTNLQPAPKRLESPTTRCAWTTVCPNPTSTMLVNLMIQINVIS